MKTKNFIRFAVILFSVTTFLFNGCKKDKTEDPTPDSSTLQQLSKDQNDMDNASNDALNDVSNVLSGGSGKSLDFWPCNATIDSTTIINDSIIYYITYSGPNCSGTRVRTGQVEAKKKVGSNWGQAGTTVAVTYINLKVTKVSSGKSIILNGNTTFTNVSGGLLVNLGSGISSIVHTAIGSVQATFDDGTIRTWNINRKRTFTGTQGQILLTVDGQATINGYSNLAVWGINRNGEDFYTQITQSVVRKQSCGWDPEAGIIIHQVPANDKKVTVTFGFDNNNLPLPLAGDECATKYRVDWEINNHTGTAYLEL